MKKRSLLITFSLCISAFIYVSCTDSFLDTTNENQVNSDSFYKTSADADAAIYSVYALLQSGNLWGRGMEYLLDFPADEVSPTVNTLGDPVELLNHTYTANNGLSGGAWISFYDMIAKANLTIKNVSEMADIDSETKKHVLAEAHFLRGLGYFYINVLYSGGPLRTVENLDEINTPRASQVDIWTQVESDLTTATTDLPLKGEWPSSQEGRVTSGAAWSMLGKAYLFEKKYTQAEAAFQEVINQNVYHLIQASEFDGDVVAAMYSNFEPDPKYDNNAESVFEVQFKSGGYLWSNGIGIGESTIRPYEYGIKGYAWYNCYPNDDLINEYEADDPRLEAFYFGPNNTYLGQPYDFANLGWAWRKYERTNSPEIQGDTDVNIDVIRYADVLLMMAEAKIQQGDLQKIQEGLDLINQVRRRADPSGTILPDRVTVSQSQAMTYLVHERRVELSGEQTRFLDLIRWDMADTVLPSYQAKNKVFPIPQDEINANTAISEENQNSGY